MGRKKKGSGAVIVCAGFFLSFLLVQYCFPSSSPSSLNVQKLPLSKPKVPPSLPITFSEIKQVEEKVDPLSRRPIKCDRTHDTYDFCTVDVATVVDPTTSTFSVMDPTLRALHLVESIRPYPRKKEIIPWEGSESSKSPRAHHPKHVRFTIVSLPLVFSAGGYTGNFFHDFNDGFIPLFITVNSFYQNQDFILVISTARDWWISKYKHVLQGFSKQPIINLDNDTSTHCFPSATLGLIAHGYVTIDPNLIPTSKTLTHFRSFLADAIEPHIPPTTRQSTSRPRLVILSRKLPVGRILLNEAELKNLVEAIGFDVTLFVPSSKIPLTTTYDIINSSEVVVGVHGAGMMHLLFMRKGSVMVQVVPLGTEWAGKVCYGEPARAIGLEYMEYRIHANESSLIEKYGEEEEIIKNPRGYRGKNWSRMDVYLKEQNVRLDLIRFKEYLEEAYRKAKKLMGNGAM